MGTGTRAWGCKERADASAREGGREEGGMESLPVKEEEGKKERRKFEFVVFI